MKVNKINILINPKYNNNKYLYNDIYDAVVQNKLGAVFNPNYIELNYVPEDVIIYLKNMGIKFTERKE